ncbi:hypothetical protein EDF46_0923 [Frondihabitans sp. PhB188]|uniref:hypothetical protein n=1 Tax=Frondihabitans sp. PhB188 TaxID=2485200 RepID=UPI000FA29D92|nr:hypothetical protein [Frondihabitans sp. PhB188]ROQ41542.1 hypothetical protein EDF46_0923 [Frondihabitans sp. PhB188]
MVDWFFGLLTPTQWDAWRGWLTTLGGLLALPVATSTYLRNGRIKREEQARLVFSKFTHVENHNPGSTVPLLPNGARVGNACAALGLINNPDPDSEEKMLGVALLPLNQTTVIIHNGSKELIGPARVQIVNGGTGRTWDDFSISVGAIDPETDYVVNFTWENDVYPGMPALATTVIFRDASGQWWRRHRSEPIEHVHDDPENAGPTPAERVTIRANQQAMGIPTEHQLVEPNVRLRVRWHRFWRARAGKSPIP